MNDSAASSPLDEYRTQARVLLKDLRADDEVRSHTAAGRFVRLRGLQAHDPEAVLGLRDSIRLKHALTVVALEHGHPTWTALKSHAESLQVDEATLMYDPGFDVLLNGWYARYEQAREARARGGGYLLPYRNQFVVCDTAAIQVLGLDPADPDWDAIGRDWVKPADRTAWSRLRGRRLAVLAGRS